MPSAKLFGLGTGVAVGATLAAALTLTAPPAEAIALNGGHYGGYHRSYFGKARNWNKYWNKYLDGARPKAFPEVTVGGPSGTTTDYPTPTTLTAAAVSQPLPGVTVGGPSETTTGYPTTLTAEAVPEPFTLLGSGVALGFGTFLKRKLDKKPEKQLV